MTSFTSRYGNPARDYKGAHIWAHCRHGATVVAISGRVDAHNVSRITESALRAVAAGSRLVLDLTGVTAFTPRGTGLLSAIDERCLAAGVDWALVPSEAVARRLRAESVPMPVIASVAQAEHHFDDEILRRRGGLLPFLRRTA
ncbi:MAG: STAS domain-containing protein [Mycobacteriaceae bacterium]